MYLTIKSDARHLTCSVAVGNKTVVSDAITAYEALSAEAQVELTAEKTLLDSLTVKITELESQ